MDTKLVETHPVLGEINEWVYKGSEHNVWRGGDVDNGGNCWSFCTNRVIRDCNVEGWFTSAQLRSMAEYIEKVRG